MIKRSATSSFGVLPIDPAVERDVLLTEVTALRAELEASQKRAAETEDLRRQLARVTRELATIRALRDDPPPTSLSLDSSSSGLHSAVAPRAPSPLTPQPPPPPPSSLPLTPSRTESSRADQGIDFGAISTLSPEQLDQLPYGLITLDAQGRVLHYNDTESRLVGLPRERVLGRNFFQDVAPCTRLREFEGRFRELVADPIRVRVKTFDFVFRFTTGHQHVTVVMTPARIRGRFHVALLRREASD